MIGLRMAISNLEDSNSCDAPGAQLAQLPMKFIEQLAWGFANVAAANVSRRADEIGRGGSLRARRRRQRERHREPRANPDRHAACEPTTDQRTTGEAMSETMALKRGDASSNLVKVKWASNS